MALLPGCKIQPSRNNSPPSFTSEAGWVIENIDPSYWTKWGHTPQGTAFLNFWIGADDPDGVPDISLITVTAPNGEASWALQDSSRGVSTYDSTGRFWGGWMRYGDSGAPHSVALGEYTVLVRDTAGHQITESIVVTSPGGGGTSGFIYSENYAQATTGGAAMIGRAAGIAATRDPSTLSITFTTSDTRVHNGWVWYYDASGNYLTATTQLKSRVNSGSGIFTDNRTNTLQVAPSDLSLGAHSFSDIQGVHVVLMDGKQYPGHDSWYDHLSISAYVQVTSGAPRYTVSYAGNGNEWGSSPADVIQYEEGQTVTVLGNSGNLAKDHFLFAGWNTQQDGSGDSYAAQDTFPMGSASVILYAQWIRIYMVSYSGNGNTGGSVPVDTTGYPEGSQATVLGNIGSLSWGGYTFAGWNTHATGGGISCAAGDHLSIGTSDVILYAQWTANPSHWAHYEGNGSDGGSVPVSTLYKEGEPVTVQGNTGGLTKTGNAFLGWSTQADGNGTRYSPGDTFVMGGGDFILYARWIPVYSVSYFGNGNSGGSVPVDNNRYASGSWVTVSGNTGTLTRSICYFAGWNTQADGNGTTYPEWAIFVLGSSDVQLHAMWRLTAVAVSAGGWHTMILKSDGTLWAAGWNGNGQLGDGSYADKGTPVQVMSGVSAVSAGGERHTLIVKDNGTLWATGWNADGQLGDGSYADKGAPVQVMSGVSAISAGGRHTMIRKTDETLWATGDNSSGQLGDGTKVDKASPVQVMSDVASVSAGGGYTMIVRTDGTLWATGENTYGQLGNGTTEGSDTPVQVMGGVAAVSAGGLHTMILKTDGTLWAAGYNGYWALGDGSRLDRSTPVQVMSGVAAVSAGVSYTMILKTNGTLWAAGYAQYGQFGDGTAPSAKSLPAQVMSGVAAVSAFLNHTLVRKTDGTVWAMGLNNHGQLGDGTTTQRPAPVQIK